MFVPEEVPKHCKIKNKMYCLFIINLNNECNQALWHHSIVCHLRRLRCPIAYQLAVLSIPDKLLGCCDFLSMSTNPWNVYIVFSTADLIPSNLAYVWGRNNPMMKFSYRVLIISAVVVTIVVLHYSWQKLGLVGQSVEKNSLPDWQFNSRNAPVQSEWNDVSQPIQVPYLFSLWYQNVWCTIN